MLEGAITSSQKRPKRPHNMCLLERTSLTPVANGLTGKPSEGASERRKLRPNTSTSKREKFSQKKRKEFQ